MFDVSRECNEMECFLLFRYLIRPSIRMNVRTSKQLRDSLVVKYKVMDTGERGEFNGIEELKRLREWLYRSDTRWRSTRVIQVPGETESFDQLLQKEGAVRVAPSLVTRSDCELLGVCYPRFAYRVFLDPEKTIFVNARRLRDLATQVPTTWAEPLSVNEGWADGFKPADKETEKDTPQTVVLNSSVVADSLLRKPGLEKYYHILMAHGLASCMGEDSATCEEGTPYAQSSPMSGHCAQAVCLMAASLLHEQARGVFAVAEINAMLHDDATHSEGREPVHLPLQGLTPQEMERYFKLQDVGLGASWQMLDNGYVPEYENQESRFQRCLRSYVLSGFPVILPVSSSRLAGANIPESCKLKGSGLGIYEANEIDRVLLDRVRNNAVSPGAPEDDHAVLVVGCHNGRNAKDFLINDPSCLPFMYASAAELADACPYEQRTNAGVRAAPDQNPPKLSTPQWVVVTPSAVTMPLEWWDEAHEGVSRSHMRPGLLHYADALQAHEGRGMPSRQGEGEVSQGAVHHAEFRGEFRLVTIEDLKNLIDDRRVHKLRKSLDGKDIPVHVVKELLRLLEPQMAKPDGLKDNHWCWLQFMPGDDDFGFLWNAQDAPLGVETYETVERAKDFLLAALHMGVNKAPFNEGLRHQDWGRTTTPLRPLKPSLLSSFSCSGLNASINSLRGGDAPSSSDRRAIDLYAFMQDEIDILVDIANKHRIPLPPGSKLNAYELCALFADRQPAIDDLAKAIDDMTRTFGVTLAGIASFVPEISAQTHRKQPEASLICLIKLCAALRARGHDELGVVQMVVGSQVNGIWPAVHNTRGSTLYVANRLPFVETIEYLLKAGILRRLADCASEVNVNLALELEPGPLYNLRDILSIRKINEKLRRCRRVYDRVGFNLDVAHFILAGIAPEDLRSIRRHIFHAHISHHSSAHWCDLGLQGADKAALKKLRAWIDFLGRLHNDPACRYDGVLTLELEACANARTVQESFQKLLELVSGK